MKPHEEEWEVKELPYGTGTRVYLRNVHTRRTVAHFPSFDPQSAKERTPAATLASAAPDMARALVALKTWLDNNAYDDAEMPEYREMTTALTKAGVLP